MTFDQISSIAPFVYSVLSTVVIGILFYKSKKRIANADAGKAEADVDRAEAETDTINLENLKNLCESQGKQLEDAYQKIEKFAENLISMQHKNVDISIKMIQLEANVTLNNEKIKELESLLEHSEANKCVVPSCPLRNPPKTNIGNKQKAIAKDGKQKQLKHNKQTADSDKPA